MTRQYIQKFYKESGNEIKNLFKKFLTVMTTKGNSQ